MRTLLTAYWIIRLRGPFDWSMLKQWVPWWQYRETGRVPPLPCTPLRF